MTATLAVPSKLDDWTFGTIEALVQAHAYEDRFDWKEMLPDSRDDSGKQRFRGEAAAMANSGGGFLIIGVKDKAAGPPLSRVVGIEPDLELAKRVGDLFGTVNPPVPFQALNPPIVIPGTGKVIAVFEVLAALGPHAIDGRFSKRTPQGAVPCRAEEVRDMFINREDRRTKLQLLLDELTMGRDAVRAVEIAGDHDKMMGLRPIDTRLIAQLHAELQSTFRGHEGLSSELSAARAQCEVFNTNLAAIMRHVDPFAAVGGLPNGMARLSSSALKVAYQKLATVGHYSLTERLRGLVTKIADVTGVARPNFATDLELVERGF